MKEPRNVYEKTLWDMLQEDGWETLKNGWPDILAVKDDRVVVIEVKSKRGDQLKEDQLRCMGLLSRSGIECYRWDKETGFLPYSEALPDVKALNGLKERRRKRKIDHICPICGKEKGKSSLVCYYCEKNPDESVQHQIKLLQEDKNKQMKEQVRIKELGRLI